jgi:hypothetical protein
MANRNARHVVPQEEKWAVKAPNARRASGIFNTQAEAEAWAKRILKNNGGGEAIIHRPNGCIRDSDTVKPGSDPHPPRDTRH